MGCGMAKGGRSWRNRTYGERSNFLGKEAISRRAKTITIDIAAILTA
jgi:hypothetical protein